jgi:hypothetical protein
VLARLSSDASRPHGHIFVKKIVPAIWFGFFGLFVITGLVGTTGNDDPTSLFVLIVPTSGWFRFSPFAKNDVIENRIIRVDQARRAV